jgi:phosphatidylserine/phosphatidylglycerophosphate/cardiolipin synthase-like enzyme
LPVTRKGARMGLHAKSLVVDRRIGVVGTHNFDPRSENYNTEGAVIIDDPAFAEQLAESILRDTHPQNSWTVAPRASRRCCPGSTTASARPPEALPILDFWPWRYATDYEFKPGPDCPQPLPGRTRASTAAMSPVISRGQCRPEVVAGTHADRIRRRPRSHPLKVPA